MNKHLMAVVVHRLLSIGAREQQKHRKQSARQLLYSTHMHPMTDNTFPSGEQVGLWSDSTELTISSINIWTLYKLFSFIRNRLKKLSVNIVL